MRLQNCAACKTLLDKGYKLAHKLKLSLRKVEACQVDGRERVLTEPNTRERQELLAKVSTAGQFFHVTNGGGPMNSNDALLAWARKDMSAKATALAKKKDLLQGFRETTLKVASLFENKPEEQWKSWTVPEMKLVIGWKQGHSPKEPCDHVYRNMKKGVLSKLYEESYQHAPVPIHSVWTDENELELAKLKSGDVEDVSTECGFQRSLDLDDEELITRLKVKGARRRMKVIAIAFRSLTRQKRRDLLDEMSLLVDVEDSDSIGEVSSGIFDLEDDSDEEF